MDPESASAMMNQLVKTIVSIQTYISNKQMILTPF